MVKFFFLEAREKNTCEYNQLAKDAKTEAARLKRWSRLQKGESECKFATFR